MKISKSIHAKRAWKSRNVPNFVIESRNLISVIIAIFLVSFFNILRRLYIRKFMLNLFLGRDSFWRR